MLRLSAQGYLLFSQDIKTIGFWKKLYVTLFGKKIICVDKMLDGNTGIETVSTIEFRIIGASEVYVMKKTIESTPPK